PNAAFLAIGYEKLGARAEARAWLEHAVAGARGAGLFVEAAELGDRLAALSTDPAARAEAELTVVEVLLRDRRFDEARQRLAGIEARAQVLGPGGGPRADVRRRIHRLEVARGIQEAGVTDARLLADADALGD